MLGIGGIMSLIGYVMLSNSTTNDFVYGIIVMAIGIALVMISSSIGLKKFGRFLRS